MIPQEADQTHIEYGFPVVKEANIFSIAEKTVPKLPNILVSMETRKPFNIFRRNILIWKKAHCAILRKLTKINWR